MTKSKFKAMIAGLSAARLTKEQFDEFCVAFEPDKTLSEKQQNKLREVQTFN